jgi:nicotinate phosphoribosyltransferase
MSSRSTPDPAGVLFTDFYQLTMAQVYYRAGIHERRAQFDHTFRSCPDYGEHKAGYCVNAGLETLVEWMSRARFGEAEIDCLRGQRGARGTPLFAGDFLDWLGLHGHFEGIDLLAIPEGRVVHPEVPVTVVQGPLAMAQILETALLAQINYQILVATKASRIRQCGNGQVLLEFGARRAHAEGALAGARAALIGGADFTSNTGISCAVGFPPKGTHAHSLVQAFLGLGGSELDAFRAYAEIYPDDCLLLVDTIDTLGEGIPNAIRVFEELRRKGHEPLGIRLDSGDLAYLSIQAAKMLDRAGFPGAKIVLSNSLDELVLLQILRQIREEAPGYDVEPESLIRRLIYGVGTRLVTSRGDSALDGVYKLVAIEDGGKWQPVIKLSESSIKVPNPGPKQVWRLYDARGKAVADLIARTGEDLREEDPLLLQHPTDPSVHRMLPQSAIRELEPLLVEVVRQGRRLGEAPSIAAMREQRDRDLSRLDPGVRRIVNPHIYHVSLTRRLWELKRGLMEQVERPER